VATVCAFAARRMHCLAKNTLGCELQQPVILRRCVVSARLAEEELP
jgi:hypothetical protein